MIDHHHHLTRCSSYIWGGELSGSSSSSRCNNYHMVAPPPRTADMMMMVRTTIPCDVEAFFVKPSFSMNLRQHLPCLRQHLVQLPPVPPARCSPHLFADHNDSAFLLIIILVQLTQHCPSIVPASTQYNISHCVILAGAGGLMSHAQLTSTS